jgi:hypothetical protein
MMHGNSNIKFPESHLFCWAPKCSVIMPETGLPSERKKLNYVIIIFSLRIRNSVNFSSTEFNFLSRSFVILPSKSASLFLSLRKMLEEFIFSHFLHFPVWSVVTVFLKEILVFRDIAPSRLLHSCHIFEGFTIICNNLPVDLKSRSWRHEHSTTICENLNLCCDPNSNEG